MNHNLDLVEDIRIVPVYREAFTVFQRTPISKNPYIDIFLKGDKNTLSDEAKKGFEIFKGKGKCIDCHYGAYLSDQKFHTLMVPENPKYVDEEKYIVTRRYIAKIDKYPDYMNIKEDLGINFKTKKKQNYKSFKAPTLKEISKTSPYMPNGFFKSLDEAIEFFNKGGVEGNKIPKPLNLTDTEKKALKAFSEEALSGEDFNIKPPDIP